jgi:hypothetical protein
MNLANLLELNKSSLFAKLDKVQRVKELYVANDVIDVLSNQKERDRRTLSDYNTDELKTYKIKRNGVLKIVRMFTKKGIERYLQNGKIFDQKNASEYFKVDIPVVDHLGEELIKCIACAATDRTATDRTATNRTDLKQADYKTTKILKWLFGKRKLCRALGEYTTIEKVVNTFEKDDAVDSERMQYLTNIIECGVNT